MDQGSSPTQNVGIEPGAGTVAPDRAQTISVAGRRTLANKVREYGGSFLFTVPYLFFAIAFLWGPLIYAFWISLRHWTTLGGDTGGAGLSHYAEILFNSCTHLSGSSCLGHDEFWSGMSHTTLFVVVTVPLLVGLALGLALLLAESPLRNFFRTVFYLPAVLSVAVACLVWKWIFDNAGVLNGLFHFDIQWTQVLPWAWVTLIATTLWWTVGFNMVILLAGVIDVPVDYHEAAKIDGANTWQRIWYITIPILRPILAFVTITTILASYGLFGQSFLITGGGPSQATEPITQYIYNFTFGSDQLARAAAMSFCMGLFLVIISVFQIRLFRAGESV